MFSRLLAGTRLSVLTALEAVGIGLVLGAAPGIATVFLGRWFDFAANRVADALMTLPSIFFAVAVTAAIGNGLVQAMFPVGILLAPGFFRVTRAATLEHARAQYVEAAELLGASKLHVIRTHVLRKVLPNIAVTTASMAAAALLTVSFLTFLGIGVQPPAPTWGGVLSSDLDYLTQAPWAPFIPGALIAITVGALNALADAFRDRATAGQPARRPSSSPSSPTRPWSAPMFDHRSPLPDAGRARPLGRACCISRTCASPCTTERQPRSAACRSTCTRARSSAWSGSRAAARRSPAGPHSACCRRAAPSRADPSRSRAAT